MRLWTSMRPSEPGRWAVTVSVPFNPGQLAGSHIVIITIKIKMIGRSAVASRAAVSTRLGQRPVVCRADGSPSSNGVAPTSTIDRPEATASQEDVKVGGMRAVEGNSLQPRNCSRLPLGAS